MITLSTTYDNDSQLATTEVELSPSQLSNLQTALSAVFTFPNGKTAANIRSLTIQIDVNGHANLEVITT